MKSSNKRPNPIPSSEKEADSPVLKKSNNFTNLIETTHSQIITKSNIPGNVTLTIHQLTYGGEVLTVLIENGFLNNSVLIGKSGIKIEDGVISLKSRLLHDVQYTYNSGVCIFLCRKHIQQIISWLCFLQRKIQTPELYV